MKRTAVLIDGGFFFERVRFFQRRYFAPGFAMGSEALADVVRRLVRLHIEDRRALKRELYRVYYYDCPPTDKQVKFPLPLDGQATPPTMNFRAHPPYVLRRELHEHLKSSRKIALRLGELSKTGRWQMNDQALDDLLKGRREWGQLNNQDFHFSIDQKAVDIKLGMDITTLALNKLADVIILIAGDSDFVPAAKLARTNGIDFVLDPMWAAPAAKLSEHVDGLRSFDIVKLIAAASGQEPTQRPSWWPAQDHGAADEGVQEAGNDAEPGISGEVVQVTQMTD